MVSRIAVTTFVFAAMSFADPAFAQSLYGYHNSFRYLVTDLLILSILILIAVFVIDAVLRCLSSSSSSGSACDCDECRAKVYESEMELMRQITKHQETHTAMMRSEIDLTRMSGVYGERLDIAAHEQRLRELRQLLQEGSKT